MRIAGLEAKANVLKAETNVLKARAAELEKVGDKFEYLDAELSKQMAFFDDFMAGKKSREQYNTQLAGLPKLMKDGTDTIRDARKLYANDPKMLARLDRIEANFRKIAAFAPAGAVVSQSGSAR